MLAQSPPRSPRRRGCCGSRRVQTGLLLVALVFLCALFLSEDLALGAGASLRTREPVAESSANSMRDAYDEDFASWKAGLSVGGQHFADAAAALVAAQAEHLQSFRLTQRQDLQTFLREQKLFREVAASEFAVAEAAIAEEAHASGIAPLADSQISDGSVATNTSRGTGRDTWAFMIPVIQTNPRRQGRLVKNLCALSWPPKELITIGFLVDTQSRPLVEASLQVLQECGVQSVNLFDDPPQPYVQPEDALARHALYLQLRRRVSIAAARNYLLRLVLRPRHTSVVWIDSDLMAFPEDALFLLQGTGADVAVPHCVMTQDTSVTYDLNSWQETPESRARVAKLPAAMPIFEGYDDDVDAYGQPQGYGDAILGECKWQQTGNCDPNNGPREYHNDFGCEFEVPFGASGYCHCSDGHIAGKSVCKHEPFTCDEVCQENSGNEGSLTGNTAFVAPMRGQKLGRLHMDKLVDKSKGVNYTVNLDGVGGTMIYAQAKIFHQGVVFPTELVNHQVETEGLAQMALRMNFTVVGLPNLIIRHA
eukprot:INCI1201.1.p1 GENE.INCI1201.1~~INCI1201.1.p1  ORF type:complete len:536 (+),score=92.35 INCI1201.1:81-1688(+)